MPRAPKLDTGGAAFAVVAWSIVLMFGTLRPNYDAVEPLFAHADKLAHLLGWFILGVPMGILSRTRDGSFIGWSACVVFGLMIETGQVVIPGRHFELWDLVADGLGAALGMAVVLAPWPEGEGMARRS